MSESELAQPTTEKQPYEKPELREYGNIRELTRTGGNTLKEKTGGFSKA